MVPTGLRELDSILGGGYPNKSTILLVGPPGIGKEALGYWFATENPTPGDLCLYVTRLAVSEVKEDIGAFAQQRSSEPLWMADQGGSLKCDVRDLPGLSNGIKEVLRTNGEGKRVRIVFDVISSMLMLYPQEMVYRFLAQLFVEIKKFDAVLVATLESGMHPQQVVASMEQLFDGVVELSIHQDGLNIRPLLRIPKMRGQVPLTGYYFFSFEGNRMEIAAHAK